MRVCVKRRHLKICFKKRIRIRIRKPGAGTVDKRMTGCVRELLKDKRGSMFPLAVAAALVMLFLILGVSEYMRLLITAAGIRDAMGSAVISTVNDNYNEVYHSVREGYAAGYEPSGEAFVSSVDHGDIYGRLCYLLGLEEDGDGYVSLDENGEVEYRINDLSVSIPNTPIAAEGGRFYAGAKVHLEVPVRFAGKIVTNMSTDLKVRAAYTEKF